MKKILEPLLKKCTFIVDSQKAFKSRFLSKRDKLNVLDHELVSFDIKAMHPNINTTKTVDYIIATVFRAPQIHLKQEKDIKAWGFTRFQLF